LFFNSLRVLSNFFLVKEGKPTEVINDNRIASVEEVLVPGVSGSLFRIKPKLSATSGLAELLPLRVGNQWAGQSVSFNPIDATIQVNSGDNVAPLIATADLQAAIVFALLLNNVICLQQHVGKLS